MPSEPALTVRELRRRWKPQKERLLRLEAGHPTHVRFHRACSWLQRVENLDGTDDLDLAMLGRWIALNALFGRWDDREQQPMLDFECCKRFLDRVLALDADGRLAAILTEHKRLVMALLKDEFLSRFYWCDPSDRQAGKSRKASYDAATWYLEKRWAMVLERVIERIYLARCQLAHGAATFGSAANRKSLGRADTMLSHLITAVLLVYIDHGHGEDWGTMCYPPS